MRFYAIIQHFSFPVLMLERKFLLDTYFIVVLYHDLQKPESFASQTNRPLINPFYIKNATSNFTVLGFRPNINLGKPHLSPFTLNLNQIRNACFPRTDNLTTYYARYVSNVSPTELFSLSEMENKPKFQTCITTKSYSFNYLASK